MMGRRVGAAAAAHAGNREPSLREGAGEPGNDATR
jgi:hypothetical protein